MATLADIVGSVLRKINAVDGAEPVKPADFEQAVAAINRMMVRWEAKGITTGWSPVFNTTDIIPAPMEAEDAIIYNAAVMLAPEYQYNLPAEVAAMAQNTLNDLKNNVYVAHTMQVNTDMPRANSGRRWNMYTDGPTDGPAYR